MILILENINSCLKKVCCFLFFFFLLIKPALAQHAADHDTIPEPPATEDSSRFTIEEATDSTVAINYFDPINSMTDSVQLREVPAATIDSLRRDDAFWYANKTFKE
ncbi:MAG TPA: hypothetical protein VGI82_06520, partial [Chitinophagaceae bacterium]